MWSSNLLLASLQKLNREKRERQPNWTESEKQLLLRLTGMHKSILENKGSDTMTIKRKSEVWDEIALRMKAAGFNRSKERLKQQLGRIRAAEAKKIKGSMEKNTVTDEIKILNNSNSSDEENFKSYLNYNQVNYSNNYACSSPASVQLQENQYIKSENASLNECVEKEIAVNSSIFGKRNTHINNAIVSTGKENKNCENPKNVLDSMHFKLQSVQSLAKASRSLNEETGICAADVSSSNNMKSSTNIESYKNDNEIAANSANAENSRIKNLKKCELRPRVNFKRSSFNREQSLRQLYTYRIAFERERLLNLKLQQKRDRILYRKDVEIQNLKLQILKNLTNQQCDANSCL